MEVLEKKKFSLNFFLKKNSIFHHQIKISYCHFGRIVNYDNNIISKINLKLIQQKFN